MESKHGEAQQIKGSDALKQFQTRFDKILFPEYINMSIHVILR
jgi:hypothetical protein